MSSGGGGGLLIEDGKGLKGLGRVRAGRVKGLGRDIEDRIITLSRVTRVIWIGSSKSGSNGLEKMLKCEITIILSPG